MATGAHDIAAALIVEQQAAGRSIDKMQLQKLLYLVQGANLEFWGRPAFRERVEAWRYGPVVRVVERTYHEALNGADRISDPVGGRPEVLDEEEIDTVRTVLRYFGTWSGPELASYLKEGPDSPWGRARNGIRASEPSNAEISVDDIAAWFRRRGVDPDPEPVVVWHATEEERQAAYERLLRYKAFDTAQDAASVRGRMAEPPEPG